MSKKYEGVAVGCLVNGAGTGTAFRRVIYRSLQALALVAGSAASFGMALAQTPDAMPQAASQAVVESSLGSSSIIARAANGGPIVFGVLLILVGFSALTWAVIFVKWSYLRRMDRSSVSFVKSFWDSRSLNDLNGRLSEFADSPVREVFRLGYVELVRSQMRDAVGPSEFIVKAVIDNVSRSLGKAKLIERRRLERYVPILAITASTAPFIGLFGTVWGIMSAFEGIAHTGSASLSAVAPGIAEALIATAFGLAAAIPAAVGYNAFNNKIRGLVTHIDSFGADFLNLVERHLVTDRIKSPVSVGEKL